MEFKVVHGRIGTDVWANTRLRILTDIIKSSGGKGKTILDLGCGKGYVGMALSKDNKVVFAEIDAEEIKDVKGARVILDALDMPFKKESFDYVICADVLEHIEDDEKVLGNIYSILKKGGKAIIALPAYSSLYGHHDRLVHHYRRYDKKPFENLAGKAGFKIKSFRYTCSLLFFPWLFNQIFVRNDKVYTGKSKIEGRLLPLLNFFSELESSIKLPFGINLQFILEK